MRKNLLSRRLKYGSSSALFTLLCLVAIALVYLTSELLTARFGLSFDMTEGGHLRGVRADQAVPWDA